jgi:hypothetical protein
MRPFFNLFGGKAKTAPLYGPPQRPHVVEALAGGAGYSVYHEPKQVTLVERDPVIAGVWAYLIKAKPQEILSLPVDIETLDDLPKRTPQEARDLIGFWFNRRCTQPAKRRSNWARSAQYRLLFWESPIRHRIASQVEKIKHWKLIKGDYTDAPDVEAHWHIDPPYSGEAGRQYKFNDIDYAALAQWCQRRKGFVHVCEQDGATWLPFEPFAMVNGPRVRRGEAGSYSAEAIFEMENRTHAATEPADV